MKKALAVIAALLMAVCLSAQDGLKTYSKNHGFTMGAGVSPWQTIDLDWLDVLERDFDTITATNEFKAYSLLSFSECRKSPNKMPVMNYKKADEICMIADLMGLKIRGHVLVWDAYMPRWFFTKDYDPDAAFVDRKTMLKRLEYYITEVITHFETNYPGLVYCWDVVNEAVADNYRECKAGDPRMVRTLRGGATNYFYEVIGDDYVELSFKYARNAVKKVNPSIKLFYNDYSTFQTGKKNAIINLIKSINKTEKLCDGMGMQSYIGGYGSQGGCMNSNDLRMIKTAIMDYAELGIEVQMTELAVRNYLNDKPTRKQHADFYKKLFQTLIEVNMLTDNALTSVTIWGLQDNPNMNKTDYSYKMNGPFCGLFDENLTDKESYKAALEALQTQF